MSKSTLLFIAIIGLIVLVGVGTWVFSQLLMGNTTMSTLPTIFTQKNLMMDSSDASPSPTTYYQDSQFKTTSSTNTVIDQEITQLDANMKADSQSGLEANSLSDTELGVTAK